jgi:RNA polymerase sigma-70 factor (ECF subfamily)
MEPSYTPFSCRDETRLIAELKQGDSTSFEHLVRLYGGYMLTISRRYLSNESDAQDAVQDAYLQAFKAIQHFEGRSSLRSWLHKIVTNSALMKIRGDSRNKIELLEDDPSLFDRHGKRIATTHEISLSTEETVIGKEKSASIRAHIDSLPTTSRHLLLLRDIEGYSTEETSKLLGISVAAVKTGLHRARQTLKTRLEHQPNI